MISLPQVMIKQHISRINLSTFSSTTTKLNCSPNTTKMTSFWRARSSLRMLVVLSSLHFFTSLLQLTSSLRTSHCSAPKPFTSLPEWTDATSIHIQFLCSRRSVARTAFSTTCTSASTSSCCSRMRQQRWCRDRCRLSGFSYYSFCEVSKNPMKHEAEILLHGLSLLICMRVILLTTLCVERIAMESIIYF